MRQAMLIALVALTVTGCAGRTIWDSNGKMNNENSKIWDSNGKVKPPEKRVFWDTNGKIKEGDRKIWNNAEGEPVVK